jgi:branched-chain amino acid transport system substrate-binding protein
VPDLGLPLNNGYYKYPNMFSIYGTQYPRDGKQTGDHGLNWNNTAVYRYFKQVVGVTKAAFFFYSEASSSSAAKSAEQQARAEGIQVAYESGGSQGENLAAPNFDADVLAMKSKNVDGVFDAVDVNGNQKICSSMDRYGVTVKAKVSTIEAWSQDVGSAAWSQPCRNSIYAGSVSVPYSLTSNPSVAQFRSDFKTYSSGSLLHQWALEGYGAGWMLVDALKAMGASPTRKGFISWLNGLPWPESYTDHGLFAPVSWKTEPRPITKSNCNSFAQWQDSAGTFVNRAGPSGFACYTTSEISTPYTDDGS